MAKTKAQRYHENELQRLSRARKVLSEEQLKIQREKCRDRQRKRRAKLSKKKKQMEYEVQDSYKKYVWLQNEENRKKQKEYKRTSDINRHNFNSFRAGLDCIEC